MGLRGLTCFSCSILVLLTASVSRAEDNKMTRPAAKQVQTLQGEISDPARFKSYVEGSLRLPEGADALPPAQDLSKSSGQAAPIRPQLNPAFPNIKPEGRTFPPAPAAAFHSPRPIEESWPELPAEGLAVAALFALSWLVWRGMREPELSPAPVRDPLPPEPADEVRPAAAPLPSFFPAVPIVKTPPDPASASWPAMAQEPYIDIRMPVATWRAISWPEQRLIEKWDASPEKAVGQASFEEWLDAQSDISGVDAAALRAKLSRSV
jgi:hypothetical protein